jgi:hypothetical protein
MAYNMYNMYEKVHIVRTLCRIYIMYLFFSFFFKETLQFSKKKRKVKIIHCFLHITAILRVEESKILIKMHQDVAIAQH